jgi:hypothetical protein
LICFFCFSVVLFVTISSSFSFPLCSFPKMAIRFIAAMVAMLTYAIALWYLAVELKPSTASLSYWAQNDDWGR